MILQKIGLFITIGIKAQRISKNSSMKGQSWQYHSWFKCSILLAMGLGSGLPLALTSGTLQAWYSDFPGLDLAKIGALSLVGLPYTLKWLWAPLIDWLVPPFLGRRRGWILFTQISLVFSLLVMAMLSPGDHPLGLALVALFVAWCSASQDIGIDAYRSDVLSPPERGIGISASMYGYRLAMVISGGLAIMLAGVVSWRFTYVLMAITMAVTALATLVAPEPIFSVGRPRNLKTAILGPSRAFFHHPQAWALLVLMVLYKLTDAFGLSLNTVFLLRGMGFSKIEVGAVYKIAAVVAGLLGALVAGVMMQRWRLYKNLIVFGVLQALANFAFVALFYIGRNLPAMAVSVFIEYFFSSIGTVVFVALLMSLCHHRYTASQFAMFSAVSALGRVFVGPIAGQVAEHFGWVPFYLLAVLLAVPGLGLLWYLREHPVWLEEDKVN